MPGFVTLKDETKRPGRKQTFITVHEHHFSYCYMFTELRPHQEHTLYLTNSTEQRS